MVTRKVFVGACALVLMSGCATLGGPKPAPDTPPNDPAVLAIQSAGDAGSIGCALIVIDGSPTDVQKARLAAAAAKTVLNDPAPNLTTLKAVFTEALPAKYAPLAAVLVQRVKVRLGGAEVIPVNSVAYGIAQSFVDSCAEALNS